MSKFYFLLLLHLFISPYSTSYAQSSVQPSWNVRFAEHKAFIENRGQFDEAEKLADSKILYGVMDGEARIYFSNKGITYNYNLIETVLVKEREEAKHPRSKNAHVYMEWIGANPDAWIEASEKTDDYYCFSAGRNNSIDQVPAFKKIMYHNLYPGIDVVYEFHKQAGLKYALIVHPGADPAQVQMNYSGEKFIFYDEEKNLHIRTQVGDIVDHAPATFYLDDTSHPISSAYSLKKNTVHFILSDYDKSKTIVIDPWTLTPNFPNSNKAYDVERDGSGNVYVFGGKNPYQLQKYTSAGTLVWTFVSAYTGWYGDLAVDNTGTCYITEGYNASNSFSNIAKVNPAGSLIYNVPAASTLELWSLSFNCDYTDLTVSGGTASVGMKISKVNMGTGAITGTVVVNNVSEPRAMSMGPNGNYYCLTNLSFGTSGSNQLIAFNPAFSNLYSVSSAYNFAYSCVLYNTGYSTPDAGMNAITTNAKFIYTSDGAVLIKRNITTGAQLLSTNIPGGSPAMYSGVLVDTCGNVFVGSASQVIKYDQNLVQLSTAATAGDVYGLCFGASGEIIACGNGFVCALNMNVCNSQKVPQIITPDTTLCAGKPVQLNASGGDTYTWTPVAGLNNPNIANPIATPTITTTYKVNIGFYCGSKTDSIKVTIQPCGIVTLASGDSICPGKCGIISASASGGASPYTYTWSSGQTGPGPYTVCPTVTTKYTVTVTEAGGTSNVQTVKVLVQPIKLTSSSTAERCGTKNGTATAIATGGSGAFSYSWDTGETTAGTTGFTAGTHVITATDSKGCSVSANVKVARDSILNASAGPDQAICLGVNSSVQLNASGGLAYSWSPATGLSNAAISNPVATPLSTTKYIVAVSEGNCLDRDTVLVQVTVPPTPNAGADQTIAQGQSTTLQASGGTTYSWSPATGLSNPNIANPIAFPTTTTTYTVVVSDAARCTSTATVTIFVKECPGDVFIPSAFSPNGDGENDVFFVRSICLKQIRFRIYNRWGELVFETTDVSHGWDGNFRGKAMDTGVFCYFVEATLVNDARIIKKGNVTLLR